MFRDALDYPTRPPEGGRAVLLGGLAVIVVAGVGGLLTLDPPYAYAGVMAVLPWLVLRGYYVRVLRYTPGHARPTPPPFDRVGRLFVDGLVAVVITAVYLLPAAVVVGPLAYLRASTTELDAVLLEAGLPEVAAAAALSAVGALTILALMYLIGALYALPVGVANYAHTGRVGAAFDVRTVVSGAYSEDYVVAWVVSILLQVLVLPVAYLLRVLIVGFFLHVLVMMGVRYCYGRGVGAALVLEPVEADWVAPTVGQPDWGELTPAVRPVDEGRWRRSARTGRDRGDPAVRRVRDDDR